MKQQSSFVFKRRNAVFVGICLGGLVLLQAISVVPVLFQQRSVEMQIDQVKAELANQQQAQTGVTLVDGLLAQLDQQPTPQVVKQEPLPQENSVLIVREDLIRIAGETALDLATVEPLLDNKKTWNSLTVHAELKGLFPDLRTFLIKLLALPYVKQIDRLEIHPGGTGPTFSLTYSIELA